MSINDFLWYLQQFCPSCGHRMLIVKDEGCGNPNCEACKHLYFAYCKHCDNYIEEIEAKE